MPIFSHSKILDGGSTEGSKRKRDIGFTWTGPQ